MFAFSFMHLQLVMKAIAVIVPYYHCMCAYRLLDVRLTELHVNFEASFLLRLECIK
jgi:hypothetical protein